MLLHLITGKVNNVSITQTWISFSESLLFSLNPIEEIGTLFEAGCCVAEDCPGPTAAVTAAWDEAFTLEATNFPGPFLDRSVVSLARPCPFMTK